MPTPNRYHDRHVLDTCRSCWRQRCDCQQAEQTRLVVWTVCAIVAFVVGALSIAGTVGLLGG
jgi:hypothetical protein